MEKERHQGKLMELQPKEPRRVFDYYIRRGDFYYVFSNWVCLKLRKEEFVWFFLSKSGLILNAAGDPICPVTGMKKASATTPGFPIA